MTEQSEYLEEFKHYKNKSVSALKFEIEMFVSRKASIESDLMFMGARDAFIAKASEAEFHAIVDAVNN